MSLYDCIDLIDKQIKNSSTKEPQNAPNAFLTGLRKKLNNRIEADDYSNLSLEIEEIEKYIPSLDSEVKNCLNDILTDLKNINEKFDQYLWQSKLKEAHLTSDSQFSKVVTARIHNRNLEKNYSNLSLDIEVIEEHIVVSRDPVETNFLEKVLNSFRTIRKTILGDTLFDAEEDFKKFQPYRIAKLEQVRAYKLGTFGACYGYTFAMVDPELSPYQNPQKEIDLNQQIHHYQKFQNDRKKDQGLIKRTRLTREYFCPDSRQLAEEIFNFAKKNEGKELCLGRRSVEKHACYVSMQNGQLRYMDPNWGAYLFDNKDNFKDFFVAKDKLYKVGEIDYRFYEFNELKYDKSNELVESKTIMGKIRTLLTGYKYKDGYERSTFINMMIHYWGGTILGAVIGALIGSVIPIIGTIIGYGIGFILGGLGGLLLSAIAETKGHRGLLGIPHLIQDSWHNFKEKYFSPKLKKTNNANIENRQTNHSTVGMLLKMETSCSMTELAYDCNLSAFLATANGNAWFEKQNGLHQPSEPEVENQLATIFNHKLGSS